jgi:hypothetical protein
MQPIRSHFNSRERRPGATKIEPLQRLVATIFSAIELSHWRANGENTSPPLNASSFGGRALAESTAIGPSPLAWRGQGMPFPPKEDARPLAAVVVVEEEAGR